MGGSLPLNAHDWRSGYYGRINSDVIVDDVTSIGSYRYQKGEGNKAFKFNGPQVERIVEYHIQLIRVLLG